MIFVVMGVTGTGKSTIGKELAARTGAIFDDGDDYHPEANKKKMGAGHPLTDEDRQPWLETLNRLMRSWAEEGKGGVLACSALKAKYRDTLSAGLPIDDLRFVWLDLPRKVLEERLQARHHEFMNPALLDSQLATLEAPSDAIRVTNDRSPSAVIDEILDKSKVA